MLSLENRGGVGAPEFDLMIKYIHVLRVTVSLLMYAPIYTTNIMFIAFV